MKIARRKNSPDNNGMADNPYNYAAAGRVSDYLESTQLNKFGTKGGTGFAAEDANALNEKLRGTKVTRLALTMRRMGRTASPTVFPYKQNISTRIKNSRRCF
jgi:hypothetical protein